MVPTETLAIPARDITDVFFYSPSCTVQVTRFVQDSQWYWREKWNKTPVSMWRGPFPSREAAEAAAGVTEPWFSEHPK